MPVTQVTPYLIFNGTAEKAIQLYQSALGARVDGLQRQGEAPGMDLPPQERSRVMHAALHIDDAMIMLSDAMPNDSAPTSSSVHVCLEFEDPQDMSRRFDALAVGGKVISPVQDTFWGAKFGVLVDAFGVPWMFNCTLRK